MVVNEELVVSYINFFLKNIVGFKNQQEKKFMQIDSENNEYLVIAMDKINRLNRNQGKLRTRVWSNCFFIFHDQNINYQSTDTVEQKFSDIKRRLPFLFIRSYVYFIFIDVSLKDQVSFLKKNEITTSEFKIWLFNSKYEIKKVSVRNNLFNITLNKKEIIDDYMYLTTPESEIKRIQSANSDAIDCVLAFNNDLELFEQTSKILNIINNDIENNQNARIIVEGPARSGKTIIASYLLGKYKNSKFLLMNYFFYQALCDGFHALTSLSKEDINKLVKNQELDLWCDLNNIVDKTIQAIIKNLEIALRENNQPKTQATTKEYLIKNIKKINDAFDKVNQDYNDFKIIKSLNNLKENLEKSKDAYPFNNISKDNLHTLQEKLIIINDKKAVGELIKHQDVISKAIEELINKSPQKFFHHNINKTISDKVIDGCWIKRGSTTQPKMWTDKNKVKLIICDEVQRLGEIPPIGNYDNFNEIEAIIKNSEQSFFTGDDFQMLNQKYDQGIQKIKEMISHENGNLKKYSIPESVGIPNEIGLLMKFLTNPSKANLDVLTSRWVDRKNFDFFIINKNVSKLVKMFDDDLSNKKHFATPMDYQWLPFENNISIKTPYREKEIIPLLNHDVKHFSYKFPYFCNEEIMPNYILSAYELISREVESLYIHLPVFKDSKNNPIDNIWYLKHLYVLLTRATVRLVINVDCSIEFSRFEDLVNNIKSKGCELPIQFL